jgi:tRNA (mo5U34)-methyltransferase
MRLAQSYQWVHTIDLGDGYTTPGLWGRGNPVITAAFDTLDFKGKRVLDIGCWDGQWSFEAEARGASLVVATDLVNQRSFNDQKTFQVAAALRGSKARYIPNMSVYDVGTIGETFDIVLYMGIYYHLKDPVRSLTSLRRVMRDNAQIIVEGAIIDQPGCFAKFYYREQFCGDNTNWWVPTMDCLKQWVECSFLEIDWNGEQWGHLDNQRHTIVARAVRRHDPLYSALPEELEEYSNQKSQQVPFSGAQRP